VLVIEDVITTGRSSLRAIEALQRNKARVVGVVACIDREEGARETLTAYGIPLYSFLDPKTVFETGYLAGYISKKQYEYVLTEAKK
jgi:orotate phosphoribosyltransferase